MNNRKNNRGHLDFDVKKSRYNTYASSAYNDERKDQFLKILIVVSIFLLAVIVILFLACSNDRSIPAFNQQPDGSNSSANVQAPNKDEHPYATVPTKQNYIASGSGTGLGSLDLSSEYALLIDLSTMQAIASKKADEQIYPASMTKVMTVVVACDLITDLDDEYTLKKEVIDQIPQGASSAWLKDYIGQRVTVKDLLYGITYRSGADAVLCLLDYLGLSVKEFAALMNEKAQEIGLTKTHFGGAIGMDTENNTTTCREIAAIMAYAMDNPLCRELFGGEMYSLKYITELSYYHGTINTTIVRTMGESSSSLVNGYNILATKSGFETLAQHCLVSYIQNTQKGEYFILVTAFADGNKTDPINDFVDIFKTVKP